MPDKKPETPEELREQLSSARMAAFGFLREIAEADAALLRVFGYGGKTNAEALLAAFKGQDKKIEQMIVDFERRHPR